MEIVCRTQNLPVPQQKLTSNLVCSNSYPSKGVYEDEDIILIKERC